MKRKKVFFTSIGGIVLLITSLVIFNHIGSANQTLTFVQDVSIKNRAQLENEIIPDNAVRFELTDVNKEEVLQVIMYENLVGEATIGFSLEFNETGTFEYTITQVIPDSFENPEKWHLDLITYFLTITVFDEDGELNYDVVITQSDSNNSQEVSEIRFVNTYLSEELSD